MLCVRLLRWLWCMYCCLCCMCVCCESVRVRGWRKCWCGVVAVSACMSGTRGSGVLSITGDLLVRGVGGVCDMCICLARGGVGGEGGEWMRELGTGGVLDMCLCFGCGGVGGIGGERVGGLDKDRERWGGVMSVWGVSLDYLCRSRYLCIVLGGYLHIWGAPSVQSCCTLWISTFWHVFVYGRYHKSRLSCLKLSDLDWSRHHPLLWATAPAIQRVRMPGMPKTR